MASFEKHVFISYAHINNQPLTPEQKGWISRFHASLEALLSMRLGQAAKIWRDDNCKGTMSLPMKLSINSRRPPCSFLS
jgi:hypothetical protein